MWQGGGAARESNRFSPQAFAYEYFRVVFVAKERLNLTCKSITK
jgi:hypothetical protein